MAMRRGDAHKHLREHGHWMQMSERVVFYALLERADNNDCAIPGFMTPSLVQLAGDCSCSKASVATALRHLEHHSWIGRGRGKGGRGHKTAYQLHAGFPCAPGCDYWRPSPAQRRRSSPPPEQSHDTTVPEEKRSNDWTVSEEKRSNGWTQKRSNEVLQTPRSGPVLDEGIYEGGGKEGDRSDGVRGVIAAAVTPEPQAEESQPEEGDHSANGPGTSGSPDWSLIKQLIQIVRTDDCGGLHRHALAAKLQLPPESRTFRDALMIAYRRGRIDFCGQYVVKTIPIETAVTRPGMIRLPARRVPRRDQ
jgi:hypothetical protein